MTDKEKLNEIRKVAGLDYLIGGTKVEEYWDWLVKQVELMQSHSPEGRNYTNAQYVELLQENEQLRESIETLNEIIGMYEQADEDDSENRTLEDWLR